MRNDALAEMERTVSFRVVAILVLWVSVLLVAGCSDDESPPPPPPLAPIPPFPTASVTARITPATATPSPVATATVLPTPTAEAKAVVKSLILREYTPSRIQGTYYPISDFVNVDSDLTLMPGATERASGQTLILGGRVYDPDEEPVKGVTVQIWQTDVNGVYLHPDHPRFVERDENFQGYGKSVTDSNGVYSFRTVLPESYEFIPRHIHVKVKFEDMTLLTTHFYFDESGDIPKVLLVDVQEGLDDSGNPILIGNRDVLLKDFVIME